MSKKTVTAIFDIGKTNKKLFFFDKEYNIVFESSSEFAEIADEDGYPCEDIDKLSHWVIFSLKEALNHTDFDVTAVNFATYGASFVLIDKYGTPVAPLYNYLKPFPEDLKNTFYQKYGGEALIAKKTASPILGNLNSGMQLFRLKYQKPEIFKKVKYALHLPQYISSLVTKQFFSELTSIGCHTQLWNFEENNYHQWVKNEEIDAILAPIAPTNTSIEVVFEGKKIQVGVGLHDSSAALIPYLLHEKEPFALISTGTWCISINPFDTQPLTFDELAQDCLCFINFRGKAVKASRLFAGNKHHTETRKIAAHFGVNEDFYKNIVFDKDIISKDIIFSKDYVFNTASLAYHQLMLEIVQEQVVSTQLVIKNTPVKTIFIDGGFAKNTIYIEFLKLFFPEIEIVVASVSQATAIGAALII
jgi:sugar (pentulose or hexulose) kinase